MRKIIERNGVLFSIEAQWIALVEIRNVSKFISVFVYESDLQERFEVEVQESLDGSWNFTGRDAPLPQFKGIPSHWPGMTLLPWKEHEC
jgi:hypothetical protein